MPEDDTKGGSMGGYKPTLDELRDRVEAFMDQESAAQEDCNVGEIAWRFYCQNEEYCRPYGADAIVHVIKDAIKGIINDGGPPAKPEQYVLLPLELQNCTVPKFLMFRNGRGEKRFVRAGRAGWYHIDSWDALNDQNARTAFARSTNSSRIKEYFRPIMENDPSAKLGAVCEKLRNRANVKSDGPNKGDHPDIH